MSNIHVIPILRDNYCYIIELENAQAIIVDPGQTAPVEAFIGQRQLRPVAILNTHHHADHVAGNLALKTRYNCPVWGPKREAAHIPCIDHLIDDGASFNFDGLLLETIPTPGHTKGHISYYAPALNALFCGDTLFSMGCGRLLEGTAEELFNSLVTLSALPEATQVYCGHEYTQSNGEFALTVYPDDQAILERMAEVRKLRSNNMPTVPVTLETELATNPFLKVKSAEDFAHLRRLKDQF